MSEPLSFGDLGFGDCACAICKSPLRNDFEVSAHRCDVPKMIRAAIIAERKRLAAILRRAASSAECGTPWDALRDAADAVEGEDET